MTLHIKELEKEVQTKPQTSRRREIIRAEINDTEIKNETKQNKTKTEQTDETRSWLFERIDKIDKNP